MTDNVVIPEAPEELTEPALLPGQSIGNLAPPQTPPSTRVGHRADADAYTRSRNKVYKRKIMAQKKAKGLA